MTRSRRSASSWVIAVVLATAVVAACGDDDGGADGSTSTVRSTVTSQVTSTSSGAGSASTAPGSGSAAVAPELTTVLRRAVEEERNAEVTYRNVIVALGPVQPFTNIADSEAQHVAALEQLTTKYGVDVSAITPAGTPSPATKRAACELGVAAEQADVALYDELLPQVTAYPDVTQVLQNLRSASQDNHLPAFQRCA